MEKIKVLYIDDERINLMAFKSSFRKDFEVFTSISASEAFPILENNEIHVIVADQRMPNQTGVSFFQEIKNDYPLTMRILITGYSDYQAVVDSINKGNVYHFLKKPWDNKELYSVIVEASKVYKLKKENRQLSEQYDSLFENSPLPLMIIEPKSFKIKKHNNACLKVFGGKKNDWENINFQDFIVDDLVSDSIKQIKTIILTRLKPFQSRLFLEVIINVEEIIISDQRLLLLQIEDLTNILEFERSRIDLINEIQDIEREHFSNKLDNGLSQELVLLKMSLESLKVNNKNELDKCIKLIEKSINHSRALSYLISPPIIEEGLINGVKAYFENLKFVDGISISLKVGHELEDIEMKKDISYNIFRMIQDFVADSLNIEEVTNITCKIYTDKNHLIISLKHNVNYQTSNESSQSILNYKNLKKRADIYQLNYTLISQESKGTEILIKSPMIKVEDKCF